MMIEAGKTYKTRDGRKAVLNGFIAEGSDHPFTGMVEDGYGVRRHGVWRLSGRLHENSESSYDLVSEWSDDSDDKYSGILELWMIQAGELPPIPVPNEEVAKAWAKKTGGRAFLMREVSS